MFPVVILPESSNEPPGFPVVKDLGPGILPDDPYQVLDLRGDAARAHQDSDQLTLIVGNGKFSQGPGFSPDNDHHVRTADVDHLPAHKPAAGKNQHVMMLGGGMVFVGMLPEAEPRGDTDHQPPPAGRPLGRLKRIPGTSPGNSYTIFFSNGLSQLKGHPFLFFRQIRTGMPHNADF